MGKSYFKVARWEEHRVVEQEFHFFDVRDHASAETAYQGALASAASMGGTRDAVSVWDVQRSVGAWSSGFSELGRTRHTIPVIGETDGGSHLRLLESGAAN